MSTHLVTELQGTLSKIEAKISGLAGSPTEGAQFVRAMQKLIHGIIQQNADVATVTEKQALSKAAATNAWKHPELRSAMEGRIKAIYDPIREGTGHGGAPQLPAGWKELPGKFIGGKQAYQSPDGKYHVAQ